jgi:hypothetical protein
MAGGGAGGMAGGGRGGMGGMAGGGRGGMGGGGSGGGSSLATTCNTPPYRPGGMGEFSNTEFPMHYMATCTGTPMAYSTMDANAHCRSEHLCNAVLATMPNDVTLHCGHANGMAPCN